MQEQEAAKYLDHLNSPWDDGLEKSAPFRGKSKGITLLPKRVALLPLGTLDQFSTSIVIIVIIYNHDDMGA